MSLDQLGRSAAEALRSSTLSRVHPEAMLTDLWKLRTRRRRAAGATAGLSVIALLLAGWLGAQPATRTVPRPDPVASPTAVAGRVLLPPLCGPDRAHGIRPPYDVSVACPMTTPAGPYTSALLGNTRYSLVTLRLPAGWAIRPLGGFGAPEGGAGLDLHDLAGTTGVTVFPSPIPYAFHDGGARSPTELFNWVTARPFLRTSPIRHVSAAGWDALQADVRLRAGAPLAAGCSGAPRCVHLFRADLGFGNVTAVELRARTTGRLIILNGPGADRPNAAIWVWRDGTDASSPSAPLDAAMKVVRDLSFAPEVSSVEP